MKNKYLSERIIQFILSRRLEEFGGLSVGRVAIEFGLKLSFISRKFKNDTKILLSKYIEYERIKRAEELIKTRNNLSIEDISKIVGFETCHHFRKIFKKRNGVTPGCYRKIIKKLNK